MLKLTGLVVVILLYSVPFLVMGCPNLLQVTCLNESGTILIDSLVMRVINLILAAYVIHFMHLTYCSRKAKWFSKAAFVIAFVLLVSLVYTTVTEPPKRELLNEVVL